MFVNVCVVRVRSAVRVPQRLGGVSGVVSVMRDAMAVPGMEMRLRRGRATGDHRQDEQTGAQSGPHRIPVSLVP